MRWLSFKKKIQKYFVLEIENVNERKMLRREILFAKWRVMTNVVVEEDPDLI